MKRRKPVELLLTDQQSYTLGRIRGQERGFLWGMVFGVGLSIFVLCFAAWLVAP